MNNKRVKNNCGISFDNVAHVELENNDNHLTIWLWGEDRTEAVMMMIGGIDGSTVAKITYHRGGDMRQREVTSEDDNVVKIA